MASLVGMSEAASIGLHAMVFIARNGDGNCSVKEIASAIGASEAHLAKVVQRLAKVGLVSTSRGPKGGVALARNPDEISFLEIFEAIEGPLEENGCMFENASCPFGGCIFDGLLDRLTAEAREKFANTMLSEHL